jgi:hypothetical protein
MTLGQPVLTKVIINSIVIKDSSDTAASNYLVSWSMNDLHGSDFMKSISIVCPKNISDILNINDEDLINKEVLVYRGETTSTDYIIFRGTIKSYVREGLTIIFECIDKLYEATKKMVVYSFDKDIDTEAGVVSEIFTTLINDYTENLVADNTSVQSTGLIYVLSKFICKSETVYDLCKKLANAMSWIFFYNPEDDKVHFEPKGFLNNTTILTNGSNIVKTPKWVSDSSLLFNKVRIDGAFREVLTKETGQIGVTAGYTTSSIQLLYIPITLKVLCDASNPPTTEKLLGVPDSTTDYDYYGDKTKMQVIWNTATYTPTTNDYVIVEYTFNKPTPIVVNDSTSISSYGLKERTLEKPELETVADVKLYGQSFLQDHKDPILATELKVTNILDLDVGQSVQIIDSPNNINNYFKIIEIKKKYPYAYDIVKVTSDILEETDYIVMIDRKLKDLERVSRDDFEFLIELKTFNNLFIYENRYLKITVVDGDSIFLESAEKSYIEIFYDNDFKSSSTTADWDNTNNWVEIATGEIVESELFAYDNNNSSDNPYLSVNISMTGTGFDDLKFYIGEYNGTTTTWSEITLTGTTTSKTGSLVLTSSVNKYGLKWKAEVVSTTAYINKLIIGYTK